MNIRKLLPIIGIVILVYLIITLDFHKILLVFSKIPLIYTLLSFTAILPVLLLTNYQWQLLLKKQKIKITNKYSLKNILIGYFYGFITPGGIGAYTRVLYLQEESKAPLQKCISNIIIHNTIDFITLLTLGLIGAVTLSSRFPYLFLIFLVLLIIIIILLALFLRKNTWTNIIEKIFHSKILNPYKNKIRLSVKKFHQDIPTPKYLLIPATISILGWIIRFSILYLISKMFLIETPYIYFILIIAIANTVASIPITIYGLGTREITLITLLSIFNITGEKIIAMSLFWFIIIWLTPSIIGAIITLKESQTKNGISFFSNKKTANQKAPQKEKDYA